MVEQIGAAVRRIVGHPSDEGLLIVRVSPVVRILDGTVLPHCLFQLAEAVIPARHQLQVITQITGLAPQQNQAARGGEVEALLLVERQESRRDRTK